jgi:hypothetical protein
MTTAQGRGMSASRGIHTYEYPWWVRGLQGTPQMASLVTPACVHKCMPHDAKTY